MATTPRARLDSVAVHDVDAKFAAPSTGVQRVTGSSGEPISGEPKGDLRGREVSPPNCCQVMGCCGVTSAICMMLGTGCLTGASYMPTLEGKGIMYGAGGLCVLIGGGIGGREYYVARLAKSLAEGIQALRETHAALQGTVETLTGKVRGLEEAIGALRGTQEELSGEVRGLMTQNDRLKRSNATLEESIRRGEGSVEAQKQALAEGERQIKANETLIAQRKAMAEQAQGGVAHFEELLREAKAAHVEKKAELDGVVKELERVSRDLQEQLEETRQARVELEERIPLMHEEAIRKVEEEATRLRAQRIEEVTTQLGQMRLEERTAAKQEAKEIREEGAAEARALRDAAVKEREEAEADLQARSEQLIREREVIEDERRRMAAVEKTLREQIAGLQSDLEAARK